MAARQDEHGLPWRIGPGRAMTLDRPRLIGILNVTPDSFSDGGRYGSVAAAVEHGLRMLEAGADAIDVGGQSTRPGARPVAAAQQIERVLPVIEALRAATAAPISIDTTRAAVAEAALHAGADAINDVSAGTEDEAMLALAADRDCGIILMHRRARPEDDAYSDRYEHAPHYDDVVGDVCAFLADRCRAAEAAGVAGESIVIDPGLGFGKTVSQNYQLIARTGELAALGYPVLSATSRKSFLGAVTGVPDPGARLAATLGASVAHWLAGAALFRVHDVAAHREALAVAAAVRPAASVGPHGASC